MFSAFPFPKSGPCGNALLSALPREDYVRLLRTFERISLRQNDLLYECGQPILYAYFPERSLVSIIATLSEGNTVQVAAIGCLGCMGVSLALGERTAAYSARVQISGAAVRIRAAEFVAEFARGGSFHQVIMNYIRCRMMMISQSAACNRIHALRTRLATLFLIIQDQVGRRDFPITHESMGQMLGSPRSEVAKAAIRLRQAGIIDYQRGNVRILRRKALEAAACECYWAISEEFERLFPRKKSADCSPPRDSPPLQ